MLINIFYALLGISFLIIVHELGHYVTARLFNIRVKRFSLGFGPLLFRRRTKNGTDFILSAFLLGGYVQFETREESLAAGKRALKALDTIEELMKKPSKKKEWIIKEEAAQREVYEFMTGPKQQTGDFYDECPPLIRMAVLIAAPLTNLLLAYLFYVIIAMIGFQGIKPVIGEIYPNTPADRSELRVEDSITHVYAKETKTWQEVMVSLISNLGKEDIPVRLTREGYEQTVLLQLAEVGLADIEKTDPARAIGMQVAMPPAEARVAEVLDGSAADLAGLAVRDKILSADGIKVNTWRDFSDYIQKRPEQVVSLEVERRGRTLRLTITPEGRLDASGRLHGFAGVSVVAPNQRLWAEYLVVSRSSFGAAWVDAVTQTRLWLRLVLRSFYELVTGALSIKSLSGPIGIVKHTGDSAERGLVSFLSILAFISLSLFVFNLLPLPMLDGGQFLFCVIEMIRGRPLSARVQAFYLRLGLVFFIILFIFVTLNDISALL